MSEKPKFLDPPERMPEPFRTKQRKDTIRGYCLLLGAYAAMAGMAFVIQWLYKGTPDNLAIILAFLLLLVFTCHRS